MNSVDRIELYEYLLNINLSSKIYQGCIYDIDILKDYAECKTRSKELTSCDLFKYKSYMHDKTGFFVSEDRYIVDIDYPQDLEFAETQIYRQKF